MSRELYCFKCKKWFIRNKPIPNCDICFSVLITCIYSIITGERITGNEKFKLELID